MSQIKNKFLSQMPTLTIKGNNTGSTANPLDLTVAQVNAILPVFTSSLNGLVPSSGGGTTNFLRADGTWAAPSGGGGGSPVVAQYYMSTSHTANGVPMNFDTSQIDTNSAVTTGSSWKFTAPSTGYYAVGGCLVSTSGLNNYISIFKNGSRAQYVAQVGVGSNSNGFYSIISLTSGDYIDLRGDGGATYSGGSPTSDNQYSFIAISQVH